MNKRWLPWIFLAPFAIAFFIFIGGWVVMWLWNALLPPLFGLAEVTFWQALGILALARILFGGWGSGGSKSAKRKHHKHQYPGGARGPFTPEERERIRQGLGMQASEGEAETEGEEE